jgi:hypothetical protein
VIGFIGDWLGIAAAKVGAEIRAYCLMPNDVHTVVTPKDEVGCGVPSSVCTGAPPVTSMRGTVGPSISGRRGSARWRLDEDHLTAAIHYVSLNPARSPSGASLRIGRGRACAHLAGRNDSVVTVAAVLQRVGPFAVFAAVASEGRLKRLEHQPARPLDPRKRGPKSRNLPDTTRHDLFGRLST